MKQKIFAVLLTAAAMMPVCCLPLTENTAAIYAEAADIPLSGSCGESLTWVFDKSQSTLTISGTGAMQNYDAPNEVPWEQYNDEITVLNIEDGVTTIGYLSFMYLTKLTAVSIPESVTDIGGNAFFGCSVLRDISIPESVSFVGFWAFEDTAWIKAKREENPFIIVNGILIDGQSCSGEITIPAGITAIGDGAFTNNSHITAVSIPDGVTSIGSVAFSRCSKLAAVSFPESLNYIAGWVFDDTPWLKQKRTESQFVIINQMLVDGHSCTGEVEIPDGIRLICGGAFDYSKLTAITIPQSTEIIDYRVFCGCSALTSVRIPEGVRLIGDRAFEECSQLNTILIPESVSEIGINAFAHCAEDFTITGYADSCAENYAAENHIPFIALEKTNPQLTGDVNEDGVIDVSDAVMLARFSAEDSAVIISAQGFKNADCNKNGLPDPDDVILIQKAIARLITLN